MNLTALAIKYNRVAYLLLGIILILGISGYNSLPRDSMPPYTIRVASIVSNFPGATPERVETLVSKPIEEVVQEIPEVKTITSTSRTGLSVVSVTLYDEVAPEELQAIWDQLRRKINAMRNLPDGVNPNVRDDDIGVVYGIFVGLTNDGFENLELTQYAEDLRDELIKLGDASKVEIGGEFERRIYVEFSEAELARLGLSSSIIANAISGTNIISEAGEINLGTERITLEASGNIESIEEIGDILITVGQESIPLKEITDIYFDYITPRESLLKIDGREAMALYISLKDGANITNLGVQVDAFLQEYNKTLPVGISAIRIASLDYVVQGDIDNFINNLLQSVIIVFAVMFMFLGLRTGVVVASLIPTAVVMTLMFMNFFTIGLNQVSLAALIMALGLLVDNAVVMAESILVKMDEGVGKVEAAIAASNELMVPLLISSLTTSLAFISFYLAESAMGDIMGPLFTVISLSLLSSWMMALTTVPLLAVAMLKLKKQQEDKPSIFDRFRKFYEVTLEWNLKRPLIFIGLIVALFFSSLFAFQFLPFIFMPDSTRNLVTVDVNYPLGTRINTTEDGVTLLESFITDSLFVEEGEEGRGVINWSSYIGVGPNAYDLGYSADEQNSAYAHILVNTTSGDDNQYVIDKLDEFAFNNLPDADVKVKKLTSGGGASVPVQIRIEGNDFNELSEIGASIKEELYTIEGTKNIDDDWGPKIKKFYVNVDQSSLQRAGLTNQDIATSLKTILSGFDIGDFRTSDDIIPIVMRSRGSEEIDYSDIESLTIFSQNTGENIPLVQVATVLTEFSYSKILKRNQNYTITVNSYLESGFTATDITSEITPWLEEQKANWPTGYEYELGGESESSAEAMSAIFANLPLAFMGILFLLVLQFNSFRKMLIILSTIPFGLIGIVYGLLLVGSYFSFTGMLGLISLAGIIINNAIVLIDRIQIEATENGLNPYEAIVAACHNRFRPILLTTFTTSFGMIPLWIGGGPMWEPMAISIIFGLLFATFITLVLVPVLYKLFFKIKEEPSTVKVEA